MNFYYFRFQLLMQGEIGGRRKISTLHCGKIPGRLKKFVSNTKKFVSNTFGDPRQAKKIRKQAI